MPRIFTFDTHEFATKVLADLQCPACTTLARLLNELHGAPPTADVIDVAGWVYHQYLPDERTGATRDADGNVTYFRITAGQSTERGARRAIRRRMAERLRAAPRRLVVITVR